MPEDEEILIGCCFIEAFLWGGTGVESLTSILFVVRCWCLGRGGGSTEESTKNKIK